MSCSEMQDVPKAIDNISNEKLLAEVGKLKNQIRILKDDNEAQDDIINEQRGMIDKLQRDNSTLKGVRRVFRIKLKETAEEMQKMEEAQINRNNLMSDCADKLDKVRKDYKLGVDGVIGDTLFNVSKTLKKTEEN